MVGLLREGTTGLNDVRRDTGAASGAPQPQGAPAGSEGRPQATPEQQAEYDQFMNNALNLIYDEKSLPQVLKNLEGGGDPIEGLASTTASIIMRLEDSAAAAGRDIPAEILFQGASEIIQDLANLAKTRGIHEFTPEDLEKASLRGVDIYKSIRAKNPVQGNQPDGQQAPGQPPAAAPPAAPQQGGGLMTRRGA